MLTVLYNNIQYDDAEPKFPEKQTVLCKNVFISGCMYTLYIQHCFNGVTENNFVLNKFSLSFHKIQSFFLIREKQLVLAKCGAYIHGFFSENKKQFGKL